MAATASTSPEVAAEDNGDCFVTIRTATWHRDSHELFDFEAMHVLTKNFSISQSECPLRCVREGTSVMMVKDAPLPPPSTSASPPESLIRVVARDRSFWIDRVTQNSTRLWLVVKDLPNRGHELAEGDLLKLGRFKLKVKQVVAETSTDGSSDQQPKKPELRFDDHTTSCEVEDQTDPKLQETPCRICLLEGGTDQDPLIAPCACKGSIEYVHLNCLKHWVEGKLALNEGARASWEFRPVACELCKQHYPHAVELAGQQLPLAECPPAEPPFVVLEHVTREQKSYHILSLKDEKVLKLGRGHESDVRIPDVSISRCHATIRYAAGKFTLEDHHSKFGTLVMMTRPRQVTTRAGMGSFSIQIGRTVVAITVQKQVADIEFDGADAEDIVAGAATAADREEATNNSKLKRLEESLQHTIRGPQQQ